MRNTVTWTPDTAARMDAGHRALQADPEFMAATDGVLAAIDRPADWQLDIIRQRRNDRMRAALARYTAELREADADYERAEVALAGTHERNDG